jgi:hypothetical protein
MPASALALFGFLPEAAAAGWLRQTCVLADSSDGAVRGMWTAAGAQLGPATANAGFPDIQPLPPEGQAYITTLVQEAWVVQQLQAIPSVSGLDFRLVEINPLLAYQLHVDSGRSGTHGNELSNNPTLEQQLGVCLPLAQAVEPLQIHPSASAMMITSRSLNVRTLWKGYGNGGFLGIHVGVTLPFVHVVQFDGRCYLHNGFHRAVALQSKGVTHIPCLFREVATAADAGIAPPGTFDLPLLTSPNPPTLAHFTTGRAATVEMKEFHRVLHVSWAEYSATQD